MEWEGRSGGDDVDASFARWLLWSLVVVSVMVVDSMEEIGGVLCHACAVGVLVGHGALNLLRQNTRERQCKVFQVQLQMP